MKTAATQRKLKVDGPTFGGYQWGEPLCDEKSLRIDQVGRELEITAAVPTYSVSVHPCDLVRQYERARRHGRTEAQICSKNLPHLRFANSNDEEELIDFVRNFGPVVAVSWEWVPVFYDPYEPVNRGSLQVQTVMKARQHLDELRREQIIYKAALSLVVALSKKDADFDVEGTNQQFRQIVQHIEDWPKQWEREYKKRASPPRWQPTEESIKRIVGITRLGPNTVLDSRFTARIIITELVNMFPVLAFPHALEMNSYLNFGIRPILYGILRKELFNTLDVAVCANSQCRLFFEVERARQQYCSPDCSRKHRQRVYWQTKGRTRREERSHRSTQK